MKKVLVLVVLAFALAILAVDALGSLASNSALGSIGLDLDISHSRR
jgi:hypothetical protein